MSLRFRLEPTPPDEQVKGWLEYVKYFPDADVDEVASHIVGILFGDQHNANLWAHGYPALLEAVRAYCASFPVSEGDREWARTAPNSPVVYRIALYDAMKACEPPAPPKKTREDVRDRVIECATVVAECNPAYWNLRWPEHMRELRESVAELNRHDAAELDEAQP